MWRRPTRQPTPREVRRRVIELSANDGGGAAQVRERHRLRDLTLLFASSLTVMAGTPVAPALPTMAAAFEGHPSSDLLVRLMLTMPGLCIGLLAPASGWMVDRFGRKPLLLWGTVLYAAAGSTGLYLDSLLWILAGRAVLGVAVSAIMTAAVTLIGDYFTGTARHRFVGLQAAFMSFGGMLFLVGGGLLADLSWRGPFAVYLGALVVVPMVIWSIREPVRHGISTAEAGDSAGEHTPRGVIGMIYAIAFFGMLALYAIPVQLPFHLETLLNADSTSTGLALACMTLFSTVSSMCYSRIKARLSFQWVVAAMLLGVAVGYAIVAMATAYVIILLGMMISGLGLGLLMPNLNVWLMTEAPEAKRGRLVGGLTMSLFLGQFASPIVLRPIQDVWGTVGVFYALAACMGVAMVGFGGYALSRTLGTRFPVH